MDTFLFKYFKTRRFCLHPSTLNTCSYQQLRRLSDGLSPDDGAQVFRRVNAPAEADLEVLLHKISTRLARFLVKQGILEQDIEHSYLNMDHQEDNPLRQVHGHSINYRIAVGPQQGKKVFTFQTLLPRARR